jgi:aspartate ammonia-lyase
MNQDEIDNLKQSLIDAVQSTVKVTVNGKIDKLTDTVRILSEGFIKHTQEDAKQADIVKTHLEDDATWKEKDAEYKSNIAPLINAGENIFGWWKVTAIIFAIIAGTATFTGVVIGLIKLIK